MSDTYKKAAKKLYKFNKVLIKCEAALMYLLFLLIVAVIVIQVVCRYALYIPTPWAEELARFACIWLVYIGAAYAAFHRDDITIDIIDTFIDAKCKDPDKIKKILDKITLMLIVGLLAVMCVLYGEFLMGKINRFEYSPSMRINMLWPSTGCMIGFILMFFHSVSLLIIPESVRE